MKLKRALPPIYRIALAATTLIAWFAASLSVCAAAPPAVRVGEIRLYMQPGVPLADVQALANTVQPASFAALPVQDAYVLTLPDQRKTDADTANAVTTLKNDPRVRWVSATPLRYYLQSVGSAPKVEPNDPRYKEQWALQLINMPQAWVLQKGAPGVNLGWLDSGFDVKHVDALGRFDPGSADATQNPIVPGSSIAVGTVDHGVATSGCAIANANNGIGIAGVDWLGINCVALKLGDQPDPNAELRSLAYIKDNLATLKVVAVNMSFGGPTPDPVEQAAIQALIDKNVIMIASAGNSGDQGNPVEYPSGYKGVISVSALDRFGKITPYSEFGKVEMSAPGGNGGFTGVPADSILTLGNNSTYVQEDGTSFAAPYVTAVVGLLMSVPGITPAQAQAALFAGANHSGLGTLPDPKYGYGILDAFGSLSRVSVQASITGPDGIDGTGQSTDPTNVVPPPVETFKPRISFHFNNVTCGNVSITIDKSIPSLAKTFTLTQLINGPLPTGVSDFLISGPCTGVSNPNYDVSFRVAFPTTGSFQHTIDVTGTDPNSSISRSDTRLFTITPHTIPSGLSMISVPYYEAPADAPAPYTGQFRDVAQLLGTNVTTYRYLVPSEVATQADPRSLLGPYARYNATDPHSNVNATFHPADNVPTLATPVTGSNGSAIDTRPIGLGFFIDTPVAIPVITFGQAFPTTPVKIPLHEGWNIIGDPFPYSVPFNATEVETAAGTRLPIATAVNQNLILPHIYRLVNDNYDFSTLPDGTLRAWEGQWVYVTPKDPAHVSAATSIQLVVLPTPTSTVGRSVSRVATASPSVTRVAGAGSWLLQLQAHVGDKSDTNNYIGMSGSATDGNDRTKVPKPPMPDGAVSLALIRSNGPATNYAQDIRSLGGTKQWNIVVSTAKPNADVVVEWPNARSLPKNYSLILTDQVTGTSLDLRNSSSYQFSSGANAGTRSFSLVARPTAGVAGHPVFSNILVNPGRAGGRAQNVYNISYNLSTSANVSVSILTPGGHSVAKIVTRAVTSGDNNMTWNGLDDAGRPVPAGSYVLQFQASTNDGQTSRVIRPLILSGRSQ